MLNEKNRKMIENADIPYVFVSINFDKQHETVSSNDEEIGYIATKYLITQGHTNIGLAGLDNNFYAGKLRTKGYHKALKEANIIPKDEWLYLGDYSYEAGYEALKFYQNYQKITAVVTASDACAVGMLNAATDYGVSVPNDLSIVSIDETNLCEIARPKLTSVIQNFELMGKIGVDSIVKKIKHKNSPNNNLITSVASL